MELEISFMDRHRFIVGQTVRLLQSMINRGNSIPCQVLQIMPFDGVSVHYRIRGEGENFERIVQEHELAETTLREDGPAQPRRSEQTKPSPRHRR
jgi:hypothetical protein